MALISHNKGMAVSVESERVADGVSDRSDSTQSLNQRAQSALQQRRNLSTESIAAMPPAAVQQALHELQVHKIELELQNEELRRMQVELDSSNARY